MAGRTAEAPARYPAAAALATGGAGSPRGFLSGATLHLACDAVLGAFPGIALVADGEGRALAWSAAAAPLAEALDGGAAPRLAECIVRTPGAGPSLEIVHLAERAVFDLAFLPLVGDGVLVLGREATFEHNLRHALMDSRKRYKDFVETSSDFAWETGAEGTFIFVSPRGALGFAGAELIGRDPRTLVAADRAPPEALPFHAAEPCEGVSVWLEDRAGGRRCLEVSAVPLYDRDGARLGVRGVCRDVTEARARDEALVRARRREALENGLVASIREEPDPEKLLGRAARATRRAFAAAACRVYSCVESAQLAAAATEGRPPAALDETVAAVLAAGEPGAIATAVIGRTAVLVTTARYRGAALGAVAVSRAKRHGAWTEDDRALLAAVAGHVGIAIQQIANHEALKALSRTDDLTGLLNRRAFTEEIRRRHGHARRTGRRSALLYVDLDNFKAVNDVHGHGAGDAVLRRWADVLARRTRTGDVTARLGGDEFAIWLEETGDAGALAKARELVRSSRALAPLSGDPGRPLSASIGVAVLDPASGEDLDGLIGRADAAMYRAKRKGKGGVATAPPPALVAAS